MGEVAAAGGAHGPAWLGYRRGCPSSGVSPARDVLTGTASGWPLGTGAVALGTKLAPRATVRVSRPGPTDVPDRGPNGNVASAWIGTLNGVAQPKPGVLPCDAAQPDRL